MPVDLGIAEKQRSTPFYRDEKGRAYSKTEGPNACEKCFLRELNGCSALQENELADYMHLSQSYTYSRRSNLFNQGEAALNCYIVTKGVARLYRLLSDGRRQIISFALPGDFLEFHQQEWFTASADAVTNVNICRFSKQELFQFIADKPHILNKFYSLVYEGLSQSHEQIMMLGCRSAEERVASFLLNLRERFKKIGYISITLPLVMSRQDIADFLGLTIETVSRTFTKLVKDRRIIIVPDGVRILDLPNLKNIAKGIKENVFY